MKDIGDFFEHWRRGALALFLIALWLFASAIPSAVVSWLLAFALEFVLTPTQAAHFEQETVYLIWGLLVLIFSPASLSRAAARNSFFSPLEELRAKPQKPPVS